MAKNIGATLTLKDGNFFSNVKSAVSAVDGLKSKLNDTGRSVSSFGDKLTKISSGVSAFVKGVGVASGAAATAIGAMVTKSVSAFSDYQQLTGGVETLFKDSADIVKNYANEAYANAGLSANEYMDTVTSFSASLINSMGGDTQAAADRANTAINDMSDNANKMGTNMESIMQTYQSISRGNYGMLDNLKLGYGGTKSEMERLLADAEKYRAELGKPVDYDISSFSDVVSAIHDIQENMGITGTTAKEAATTISGSANMLKASWKNALTAVGTGGDGFKTAMDNLVNSAKTFGQNIIPAIETALGGVGQLVQELALVIAAELPGLVSAVLPGLVSAVGSLISGVASQIPTLASTVLSAVPTLFDGLTGIIGTSAVESLKTAAESIGNAINSVFSSVSGGGMLDTIQTLASAALPALCSAITVAANAISFMANNWKILLAVALPVITPIVTALGLYKGAVMACNVYDGIKNKLISANSILLGTNKAKLEGLTLKQLAHNVASKQGIAQIKLQASVLLASGKAMIVKAANCVKDTAAMVAHKTATAAVTVATKAAAAGQWLLNAAFLASPIGWIVLAVGAVVAAFVVLWNKCEGFRNFWINLWNVVKSAASAAWNGIKSFFGNIGGWFSEKFSAVKSAASKVWNGVKETTSNVWNSIKEDTAQTWAQMKASYEEHGGGLKGAAYAVMDTVKSHFSATYDYINNLTGGKLGQAVETVKNKLSPMINTVKDKLSGIKDAFGTAFGNALDFVKKSYNEGALKPIVDKIANAFSTVKNAVAEKFNGIKEAVGEKLSAVGNAVGNVKDAIADKFSAVKDAVVEKFTGIKEAVGEKFSTVADSVGNVKDAIAGKFSAVKDAVISKFTDIKTALQPIVAPIAQTITAVFSGAKSIVVSIVDGIKTHISNSVNIVKTTIVNIITGIKQNFTEFANNIKTAFDTVKSGISTVFEGVKNIVVGAFQFIVGIFTLNIESIKTGINTIKTGIATAFEGAKTIVLGVWNAITSAASLAFNNIKTVVTNVISGIKNVITSIKTTFTNVFNSVKNTVSNVFNSIKNTISNVWNGIKSLIKTPHIVKTGTISIAGIDTPIPKLGIEWYAKGGILNSPTLLGFNGNNAMVGGESGAEAVVPLSELWRQIRSFAEKITGTQTVQPQVTNNTIYNTAVTEQTSTDTFISAVKSIIENLKSAFSDTFLSINAEIPSLSELWQKLGAFADGLAYQPQLQPVPVTNNIVRVNQTPQNTSSTVNNIYVTVDGANTDDVTLADRIAKRIADAMNNM